MIFLDESGKRWKRIKHSTAGIIILSAVPVAALLVGSLAQPDWGNLPAIKQITGAVLSASKPQIAAGPKPTTTPSQSPKPAARQVAYKPSSGQTASSISNLTPTPQPTATATPKPTPSPAASPSGNPSQNDFGQAHKPTR